MRRIMTTAAILLGVLAAPSLAAAQNGGSVSFVTGMSVARGNTLSSIASAVSPGAATNVNLAGRVNVNIAPGFQAVAEVGRLGSVLPPLVSALSSFSPYDVQASALYGEGGVRAFVSHRSAVNPYVEATAGYAHLNMRVNGISATTDDLLNLGFGLTSRTSPMAGLGGGVMFRAGRLTLDGGYRYKKIFAKNLVTTILGGGSAITSHQVAFGIGVGF
jgi:hypothetical protein